MRLWRAVTLLPQQRDKDLQQDKQNHIHIPRSTESPNSRFVSLPPLYDFVQFMIYSLCALFDLFHSTHTRAQSYMCTSTCDWAVSVPELIGLNRLILVSQR